MNCRSFGAEKCPAFGAENGRPAAGQLPRLTPPITVKVMHLAVYRHEVPARFQPRSGWQFSTAKPWQSSARVARGS
jgi:hypothetical protein